MAKKMKKNVSNVKQTDKKNKGRNNSQEKKPKNEKSENQDTPSKVKDRSLKFKNKQNKLAKKIKQSNKIVQNRVAADIVNPEITKVINVKKKGQNKKTEPDSLKGKKHQPNREKQKSNKKPQATSKISDPSSNKTNGKKNSAKKAKSKHQKDKSKQEEELNSKGTKLKSMLEKRLKQKDDKPSKKFGGNGGNSKKNTNGHNLDINRLQKLLETKQKETKKEKENVNARPLRERMMFKLRASRFRYLNETLYNNESSESKKFFKNDPEAFKAYHEGYKQQVEQWPLNPLDVIISSIKKMPKEHIIADFGCGEAKLAASVPQKVHSFDFVSLNENVTVCDIAHTPLLTNGAHVVVFCLSLMGTNLKDYIVEANRVLKKDGVLKIAEVESRFDQVEDFINTMSRYGFKNTWKDLSHNLFYFLDFKKERDINNKKGKLPPITLKSCLYKKR